MQMKGLRINERDTEKSTKLTRAIKALPDQSIKGLNAYEPSNVYLERGRVVIKRSAGHGEPLIVNFPRGSTKNVAKFGLASFEYRGRVYEIYQ